MSQREKISARDREKNKEQERERKRETDREKERQREKKKVEILKNLFFFKKKKNFCMENAY